MVTRLMESLRTGVYAVDGQGVTMQRDEKSKVERTVEARYGYKEVDG